MGSATYICSDKTGTLTLNQMYMIKFQNLEVRETYKEVDKVNDKGAVESERNPLPYNSWVKEENRKIFEIALTANSMTDPTKSDGNPTELAITRYMYLEGKGINTVDMIKKKKVRQSRRSSFQF